MTSKLYSFCKTMRFLQTQESTEFVETFQTKTGQLIAETSLGPIVTDGETASFRDVKMKSILM